MDRKCDTMHRLPWGGSFIDVKNLCKTWLNLRRKMMLQLLKLYHQKMVIFFEKKMMKAYFKAVILSIKIYQNILKFNFLMAHGGY